MLTVNGVPEELQPIVAALFAKVGLRNSSIMALVGFTFNLNGRQLSPNGVKSGDNVSPLLFGDYQKKITYEDLACWLVANEMSLMKEPISHVQITPEVKGFVVQKYITPEDEAKSNWLYIRQDEDNGLLTKEIPFDLGGKYDMVDLKFLFVRRDELHKLPVEYSNFREEGDEGWLTLGMSVARLVDVCWQHNDGHTTDIQVKPRNHAPLLEQTYREDINKLLASLSV